MKKNDPVKIVIGQRIRALREEKGLSLRALAEQCGLSFNAISRVERGDNSPTVSTLHRLATALGVPITSFFAEPQEQNVVFTKKGKGIHSVAEGIDLENIASGLNAQNLEPFILVVQPGFEIPEATVTHHGEEFIYCLEGQLEYVINEKSYILEPGDSLLFKAVQPHFWRNLSKKPAKVILVFQSNQDHSIMLKSHLTVDQDE